MSSKMIRQVNILADAMAAAAGKEIAGHAVEYAPGTYGAQMAAEAGAILMQLRERGYVVAPAAKAFEDVMAERRRQVEAKGWTPEHDDQHYDGSMARAAAAYAYMATLTDGDRDAHKGAMWGMAHGFVSVVRMIWPWAPQWFKPTDPRRDLVKAGALILAEIERLDRAAASTASKRETAVRCSECGWIGESTDLGAEGECGGEGCPSSAVSEITDPAAMLNAWMDSDGHYCGKQLADAGLIAPRPATAKEADARDLGPGATVWDLTEAGEAVLNAAKAEA